MSDLSSIDQAVVLGGGYAGLRAALDLAAACRLNDLGRRITLVDRTAYHQLVTALHRAATEGVDLEACRLPLDELLVPGTVERRQAAVTAVDPRQHTVQLDDGGTLTYDRLVVALGSSPAQPALAGLRQHGFQLREWSDAEKLRDHLRRAFREAASRQDGALRQGLLTVVLVGGGATGCQLAGELSRWLPRLADQVGVAVAEVRLLLVESGSRLLQQEDPQSSDFAYRTLRRKGVEVLLETTIGPVAEGSIELRDGPLPTRTVIWTGGVEAPPLLKASGLPVGHQGRVTVDCRLRAEGLPEIYVAGDTALFEDRGRPLPATAAVAQHQGAYVAAAITREMMGEEPEPYRPRELGRLVSLGGSDAVGTMLGRPLQGSGAGFVKQNIELWYESTVTRRLPLMDL